MTLMSRMAHKGLVAHEDRGGCLGHTQPVDTESSTPCAGPGNEKLSRADGGGGRTGYIGQDGRAFAQDNPEATTANEPQQVSGAFVRTLQAIGRKLSGVTNCDAADTSGYFSCTTTNFGSFPTHSNCDTNPDGSTTCNQGK